MASIGSMVIGEKLGLYEAMAEGMPTNAEELANEAATDRRYVHE